MKKQTNNYNSLTNDGEIDLFFLIRFLQRNLKFISYSSALFLIFGIFFAQTRKKVWEGQFEIVIEKENRAGTSSIGLPQNFGQIANFANLQNLVKPNSLKTEVGILQSSSVLLPIFENLKKEKLNSTKNNMALNFSSFKSNLKISLRNKTTILNIKYRDTQKERILPVLKQISMGYQKYSGANKDRGIELAEDYLEKQIKKFRLKSNQSIKKVQEYAIDKDLTIPNSNNNFLKIGNLPFKQGLLQNNSNTSSITSDIEEIRINAVNQIKTIDSQLEKLYNFENEKDIISFVFNEIPVKSSSKIISLIEKNEIRLLELKTKYKKNDKRLDILKEERKILGQLIREKAITLLRDKKFALKSQIDSASRPKEVLIKYRELLRNSERDELTLIDLENQLRSIKLEKSRTIDPWKLISEPQLNSSYVEPNKTRIILIGLFIGIITGSIISKLKEIKSGLIYDKEIIENIFSTKFISTFLLNNDKAIEENKLFEDIFNSSKEKKINLIYFGEKSTFALPTIDNYLTKLNKKEKRVFLFADDLSDICINHNNYLLIEDSDISLEKILILFQRFEILGIKIKGIFNFKINVNLY